MSVGTNSERFHHSTNPEETAARFHQNHRDQIKRALRRIISQEAPAILK